MTNATIDEILKNALDLDLGQLSAHLAERARAHDLPQRALYIAYNFPPYSDASAVTVAKRIQQIGWQGEAIAQDMSSIRHIDNDLQQLIDPYISNVHCIRGTPIFSAWRGIRNYVLAGYARVREELRSRKIGFIYSRAMFPAPHFLAAYIKAKHPEVTWVAEFSDPVRHDVEGKIRASGEINRDHVADTILEASSPEVREKLQSNNDVLSWCDLLGNLMSDIAIYTNVNQAAVMLSPYLSDIAPNGKIPVTPAVSPHPTLSKKFYNLRSSLRHDLSPEVVNIGYFGEFYPNRGVGELIRAAENLEGGMRDRMRVYIYTSSPAKAAEHLNSEGLESGRVVLSKSRSLFDFLQLAQRMDALYVSDVTPGVGYDMNPYLPSKLSDYRGAGTPIISSVWPGSVMSRDGAIKKILLGDIPKLADCLQQLILAKFHSEWRENQ